ncbi:MAG TPA: hypothetical protein VLE89_00840 [Chlamydiales bacterium]|nr:hypothetical protein [Chlamydiales bacterium]
MAARVETISSTFIWRRVHSLMGLWLVLYLIEHLLVNSQAALWIGDDGSGFVKMVDSLESLPYLQVIEIVFIAVPLAIHGVWGVKRALDARLNSSRTDGSSPSMKYARNRAFTWQRLTSWILLFGIIGHVVQMRFLDMPKKAKLNYEEQYFSRITMDDGLSTLAPRLGVTLYTREQIAALKAEDVAQKEGSAAEEKQKSKERMKWLKTLDSFHLRENQVVAVAPLPGKAILLTVRDTFKSPVMGILYTIFVLAAAFHAFNGFWTSLITWGAILSYRSQKAMLPVGWFGMALLSFLGLAAIWGSYWVNLRS